MVYSDLTDVCIPVYGKSNPRIYEVSKITVHHMAGDLTVETCAEVFRNPSREASSNYGIGSDGRIACYVSEDERAWTSNSWWNDQYAITIEVADYDTDEWSPSDEAYESTVRLCADICNRYGIVPEYTGDQYGTFTEHMMFASTSCPGPWWHERMEEFVEDVKAAMEGEYMAISDTDIARIWEYQYKTSDGKDTVLEDKTGIPDKDWNSNRYNVHDAAFMYAFDAFKKAEECDAKLDKIIELLEAGKDGECMLSRLVASTD